MLTSPLILNKTTNIRPIWFEVDYLPPTHGFSIFTRRET